MECVNLAVGIFRTNCYLFHDQENVWIIDPGAQSNTISHIISEHKWTVQAIILTHGHFDHILAVPSLHTLYPEAKIMIHKQDSKALGAVGKKTMESFIRHVDESLLQEVRDIEGFPSYTHILEDQQMIEGCELKVLHTPGHSMGSVSLYHEKQRILFSGDTLFYHTVGRTDLPFADHSMLIESIRKKLLPLEKAVKVYPGHGKMTTIGDERLHNPFLN